MACSGQKKLIQPRAVVANEGMNAVYIGIDNPISVAVDGYLSGQIFITTTSACKLSGDSGIYFLNPPETQGKIREIGINVYAVSAKKDTVFIDNKVFCIKRIPIPAPFFGSKNGGYIGRGEIQIVNFITVRLEDFPFDIRYNVTSFKMIFQPNGGYAQYYVAEGPRITPEMKMVLNNVQKGDKFIIKDIKISRKVDEVMIPDNREVGEIHLIVK